MPPTNGNPLLQREDVGDVTVVRLMASSTLDDHTVRAVFDPIDTLVGEMGRNRLVLNLAAVQSVGSLALCKLVKLNRKVHAAHGQLVLCELSPTVTEVFETTLLTSLFRIRFEEQEALQSCSSSERVAAEDRSMGPVANGASSG